MSTTNFLHELQTKKGLNYIFYRFFLYIFSLCYKLITSTRNKLYKYNILKTQQLPVPVISIGNIVAGGTGKTPFVIWLAQNIKPISRRAVLLSRGYGGDEKQLFEQVLPQTPHFTNSKRFVAGKDAINEYGKNIYFILDDGFQHRQLHRNINIVLIDTTCPFGYDYILPRGFLRESLQGLKRADIFVLTRCNMVTPNNIKKIRHKLDKIAGKKLHVLSNHVPLQFRNHINATTKQTAELAYLKAYLFSGIGNPKSFHHLMESLSIEIVGSHSFEDHYQYQEQDIALMEQKAHEAKAEVLITTAKDAVKLPKKTTEISIWILDIAISVTEGKEELLQRIENIL